MNEKERSLLVEILEAVEKLPKEIQYYVLGYAQGISGQKA